MPYLLHYGSEEQRERFLRPAISGDCLLAIAMTEPGTGSDLAAVQTRALRDGDEYVIDGAKTFISNGQNCDLVIVVAKTDPAATPPHRGISLILVETDRPGFDINNFTVRGWQECERACAGKSQCGGWSYARAGVQGPQGRCWIKSRAPHSRWS